MLTDVFYTRLKILSLKPRHRCVSVVTLIRTVTTERMVQNLVINVLMHVTAELTQKGSVVG